MSDNSIFRVQVLEGRGFGEDPQTLLCTAQFACETKSTQYSVNTDTHIWNSTLSWSLSREELRKAHASGSTHCKVSVLRKDGTRLGWVVVSLRSAKLQSQYKSDPQGQWMQLNASKLADPPQLRIAYALCEERLLSQLDHGLSSSGTLATVPGSLSKEASSASLRRHSSSSAAASLRPSKSLSGKQRLSAAIHDTSSLAAEQQELDEAPLAAVNASACAESSGSGTVEPSTASGVGQTGGNADSVASPQQQVEQQSHQQEPLQHEQSQQEVQQPQQQQQVELQQQQHSVNYVTASGAEQPATTAYSDAVQPIGYALHDVALAEPAKVPLAADTAANDHPTTEAAVATDAPAMSTTVTSSLGPIGATQDALVAAAEASLPSFAQRRQQQQQSQLQQAKLRLEQQRYEGEQQQQSQQEQDSLLQQLQQSWQPPLPQQQQQAHSLQQDEARQHQMQEPRQQHVECQPEQQQQLSTQHSSSYSPSAAVPAAAADNTAGPSSHSIEPAAADEQAAVAASAAGGRDIAAADAALPPADPVRQFVFTLDVRSFQAGRRLPVALASAYVTAFLPQEFIAFLTTTCGAKLPPKLTPLRALPAVDVLRGSEGGLPNGCASASFSAGVVGLAGLLAQEPRVVLEVWHKEKLRSDTLLGVASVSLSALLQECWVDGYAPVYALMRKAADGQEQEEKVQVGMLRVVLSLEDKGPPASEPTAALTSPAGAASSRQHQRSSSHVQSPPYPSRSQRALTPPKQVHPPATTDFAAAGGGRPHAQRQQQLQQQLSAAPEPAKPQQQPTATETNSRPVAALPAMPDEQAAIAAASAAAAGLVVPPGDFRQMPEYLVAWELEVWKRAEEARFRAELKELEQQRMAVIEAQWWKRERARESEVTAVKAEYARLEQQTKALLSAVQEREAKLVAAEADLRRRQSDLERQQAARMSEAEAAVRRLQVECEHQLSLERDRTAAVARQRDAAEARLLAAEARAAAMEAQFTEYRAAQWATPEGQLQIQLQEAQAAAAAAQTRAGKAVKARKHYKDQVMKLARELAALHQQRQQEQLQQQQRQQEEAKNREQSSAAAAQAAELSGLREQLAILRAAAMAAAAAEPPVHPHSPTSSDMGWPQQQHNKQRKQRHRHDKENDYQQHQQDSQPGVKQHKQSLMQEPKRAGRKGTTAADAGQAYSDAEESPTSRGSSDYHSDAGGASEYDGSSSEDELEHVQEQVVMAHSSRRARLQKLQEQQHKRRGLESVVSGKRLAAAAGAVGAAADAALAEVAALAAILNQPRPGSAQAKAQQQQEAQSVARSAVSPVPPAAQQQRMSPGPMQPASCSDSPEGQRQHEEHKAADAVHEQHDLSPGVDPLMEVRRLLKEKVELLASGLYGRDDAVILQIDARVQALAEQQLAG